MDSRPSLRSSAHHAASSCMFSMAMLGQPWPSAHRFICITTSRSCSIRSRLFKMVDPGLEVQGAPTFEITFQLRAFPPGSFKSTTRCQEPIYRRAQVDMLIATSTCLQRIYGSSDLRLRLPQWSHQDVDADLPYADMANRTFIPMAPAWSISAGILGWLKVNSCCDLQVQMGEDVKFPYRGGYFEAREAHNFQGCRDIFGPNVPQ